MLKSLERARADSYPAPPQFSLAATRGAEKTVISGCRDPGAASSVADECDVTSDPGAVVLPVLRRPRIKRAVLCRGSQLRVMPSTAQEYRLVCRRMCQMGVRSVEDGRLEKPVMRPIGGGLSA